MRTARYKDSEDWLPQHAIVRDLRIRDLGIESRLDPNGIPLPERLCQRRCVACKRLKGASNILRGHAIPTGADPADINNLSTPQSRTASSLLKEFFSVTPVVASGEGHDQYTTAHPKTSPKASSLILIRRFLQS
jgi:hypothetical protein